MKSFFITVVVWVWMAKICINALIYNRAAGNSIVLQHVCMAPLTELNQRITLTYLVSALHQDMLHCAVAVRNNLSDGFADH